MKRAIGLLLWATLCCLSIPAWAQHKGESLGQQAQESLAQKNYTRARVLFQQAYEAYAADARYREAVACGVQAAALYHRENDYKAAFALLYGIERMLVSQGQRVGETLPALRYAVTRERLRMYIKLRKSGSAKEQLDKLAEWEQTAQTDSLETDLLYAQANYCYSFGRNSEGDAALDELVKRYAAQKDYAKAEACYREMISMGRRTGNSNLMAKAYDRYMHWHDSIQQVMAQARYDTLQAQYDAVQQTIAQKDDALDTRSRTVAALCVLALILAAGLVAGGVVLMRFVALSRKQQKDIRTAREHDALKTQFIGNISAQMRPTLDTLDGSQPGVQALKDFTAHIEQLSALEKSLDQPYELSEINVATFCEEIMNEIRGTTKADVTLTVNAPKLMVRLNEEHTAVILRHLLHNAAIHTPAEGKIWLDFKKRGAHTHQFVVSDTGSGISMEARESLFKPFNGVRDLTQGDGLGLPICALEARKMNGHLSLDTEYTKGARFVLELHA